MIKPVKRFIYDQDNEMISKDSFIQSSVNRNVCKVDCYAEKNSNSGSDLATYIASNAELLTEKIIQILMRWSLQTLFIGVLRMRKVEVFTNKYY